MLLISFHDIDFKDDRIVWMKNGETLVWFRDVFAISYKKASFYHLLTMAHEWMIISVLYICTKSSNKIEDLIPIKISYDNVKKLPKNWLKKVEFYQFGKCTTIEKIIGDHWLY